MRAKRPQDLRWRITQTEGDLVIDVERVLIAGVMQAAVPLWFLLRQTLHGAGDFASLEE